MDEYVMKQKIQKACFEPRAPEGLVSTVILRAQAAVTGAQTRKQAEQQITGHKPAEKE